MAGHDKPCANFSDNQYSKGMDTVGKEEGGCVGSRARHYCERVLNQREMSENEHEIQINVGGTTMLLTSGWGVVN